MNKKIIEFICKVAEFTLVTSFFAFILTVVWWLSPDHSDVESFKIIRWIIGSCLTAIWIEMGLIEL